MFRRTRIFSAVKNLRAFTGNALCFNALLMAILAVAVAATLQGQQPSDSTGGSGSTATSGGSGSTAEQNPTDGGPNGDTGSIIIHKKKTETEPTPPPERAPHIKNPEGLENYTIRVDVPIVNLNVQVVSKDGMFIPGLQKQNFKVLEDGVPQTLMSVQPTQAPITAVLLVEFARTNYSFMYDALNASYTFASTLKPDDWVAVEYYSMRPHILLDF